MGGTLRHWQAAISCGLAALVMLTLLAPPLIVTIGTAADAPLEPWRTLFQQRSLSLLGNSVLLALATTAASMLIGVPLGTMLARTRRPFSGCALLLTRVPFLSFALFMHAMPLTLPPFVNALAVFQLLRGGGWLGLSSTPSWLFDFPGCVLILTISLAPIVTVLTWLGVRATDPSGDEAARVIAGPWNALWRVVLPQAAPSITLGAIIVFALALVEVAVPMFLRVDAYSAAVFARLGGFAFAPGEAAVLAAPLLVFSLALWILERITPPHRVIALPTAREATIPLLEHTAARIAVFVTVSIAAAIGALPLIVMIAAASQANGFALLGTYAGNTIMNSMLYAASVSTIVVALAVIVVSVVREHPRFVGSMDALAWLGFLLPPALFAIGAIDFWNRQATQWMYGSVGIVILALAARYAALAIRIQLSGQYQLSPSLDEAARTLGASYLQRLTRIQLPALRRFAFGAWLLVFVFCLRDIETTALLYPPGGESVTVRLFTLEANGPPSVIAALAVVLAVLALIPLATAALALRRFV